MKSDLKKTFYVSHFLSYISVSRFLFYEKRFSKLTKV